MIQSDSVVINRTACPYCRAKGKDRSGDNLAIYSDGHSFCFSCGYRVSGTFSSQSLRKPAIPAKHVVLPEDVTTELPYEAREWLNQYELSVLDIKTHFCMWSERCSRLIFPYFDNSNLIAWQGRYISCGKNKIDINGKIPTKWFSQGNIHEFIHTINVTKRQAIIVEDIVSAIKVSKFTGTIPLFGSTINNKQILRYKHIVDRVWYWLDPDKRSESVSIARKTGILGLPASVIMSEKDPKEHTYNEIKQILIDSEVKI